MSQAEGRRVDRLCSVAVYYSLEEDRTTLGNCKFFYQEMLYKQAQKPWHTLSEASLIPSEGHLNVLKNLDVKGPVVFDSPSRTLGSKVKAPTGLFYRRKETACLTDDVPFLCGSGLCPHIWTFICIHEVERQQYIVEGPTELPPVGSEFESRFCQLLAVCP